MKELGLAGTKLPVGTSSWKCNVGGYWKIPAEVWCLFQAQSLILASLSFLAMLIRV